MNLHANLIILLTSITAIQTGLVFYTDWWRIVIIAAISLKKFSVRKYYFVVSVIVLQAFYTNVSF